jgi:hypothetical protein
MADAVLVGNNLAVLVAAAELGEAGAEVVLLHDVRPPGGHFRGLRLPEADFDIGMVVLEQSGSVAPVPDLAGYRPDVRYDWTRFGARADQWLRAQVPLVRTPTPQALVEGQRWPDHLLTNRLDVLAAGNFSAPGPVSRDNPMHAAAKVTAAEYDSLTYASAAELNHGSDIQRRLVDPFAAKVFGPARNALLARYHRAGWLPLYWPETLAAACDGRPTGLPENEFWTTPSGFAGDLVRALEGRLARLPHVQVHSAAIESLAPAGDGWEVRTGDGGRWSTARPVLGLSHERVQALLGLPGQGPGPSASVVVVCCLVRASAIGAPVSSLSVVDPEFTTYRVTDQDAFAGLDPEWHRVVIEAGPAAAARHQAGEDVPAGLVAELCRLLDIPGGATGPADAAPDVRVVKSIAARGALAIPTVEALAAQDAAHTELVAACPSALLTGALLGLGATSMNDQIVQGLAVAQELR